ncbi:MAG TPA: 16S rRNA (adenine(1518)-N(6)/adenine(1519)-N(6))-dimethyltransferase RsmA [Vicinamibacterales bacterium]|nr:16S rRNA (adenine(1518)-N(6)/adenine(1519)-N(6))-dimethyltransferase RsmA [Vicinamibacterales bacterium]
MKARKRFGQHFLEPAWVRKVVAAIAPQPDDVFVEVGPGRGALTRALAPLVSRVLAIEVDRDLAASLRAGAPENVTIVEGDFLETGPGDLPDAGRPWRAAGNLPYNLSTPILFHLLALADEGRRIRDATLMLQREVAERLAARPGTKAWGVLSATQQLRAAVEKRFVLPPGAFRPPPRVHSAVVNLRYHPPAPALAEGTPFDALVRTLFMQRRKVLDNALEPFASGRGRSAGDALAAAGIDGRRRPETLGLDELAAIAAVFLRPPNP